MQHLFWVVPNLLAGRAGPDRQSWDLSQLRIAGFGAVLSVNDGVLCHPEDFRQLQIAYSCVPLSPNAPPRPGDLDHCIFALPAAYTFVAKHLAQERKVLVHCSSGKDRTGLFFGYFLMRHFGQSPSEAIANVLAVRPIAYTAEGWQEFALLVLSAMRPNRSFNMDTQQQEAASRLSLRAGYLQR
jgi:hypothetical protein